jgi:Golgi SNAP receptor complex protein 2
MHSVRNSARELENANALGEAILSSIHGQREHLKVFRFISKEEC